MTKKSNNRLEQTCIKSINEICECRKTCRQAALKFVCQVTVLAVKRKASTPASIDKLLKELFTKARRKLSSDLKTRYRQAVLYLFLKKGLGTEQALWELCHKLSLTSCRKLSDAYTSQTKKVPAATSGKSAKAKHTSSASKSSASLKKVPQTAEKSMADSFKQVKRLIQQVSKTKKKGSFVLKKMNLKITVTPV